jgi:hypothetical protein
MYVAERKLAYGADGDETPPKERVSVCDDLEVELRKPDSLALDV